MKLGGVNTLQEAETTRGSEILVKKETLPGKGEDEYYWYELFGMSVYLDSGKYVGTVRQILPTDGHDIYVVQDGKREVLIPATHEVVESIDLENRKMIISQVEGLLDLNEV
jgi:16S rRNA processing protein RimM